MEEQEEKYLFEEMPVPKAVATLAVPTIISQVVTMIYNLADTFFVGQLGDPAMVAAVSLVSPWFNLLTALGNLFGLGGSSLISRMLGIHDHKDIKYVAAFSIWGGGAFTLLFSLGTWLARRPLLGFLGASPDTWPYAQSYLLWVVAVGGVPTMVSLALGHLLRSEGHARQAAGHGQGGAVGHFDLQPAGPAEHPPADPDGPGLWAVRHDLDPAGGGGHHAAGLPGDVLPHLPQFAKTRPGLIRNRLF